jgi:hypothetical protein
MIAQSRSKLGSSIIVVPGPYLETELRNLHFDAQAR